MSGRRRHERIDSVTEQILIDRKTHYESMNEHPTEEAIEHRLERLGFGSKKSRDNPLSLPSSTTQESGSSQLKSLSTFHQSLVNSHPSVVLVRELAALQAHFARGRLRRSLQLRQVHSRECHGWSNAEEGTSKCQRSRWMDGPDLFLSSSSTSQLHVTFPSLTCVKAL